MNSSNNKGLTTLVVGIWSIIIILVTVGLLTSYNWNSTSDISIILPTDTPLPSQTVKPTVVQIATSTPLPSQTPRPSQTPTFTPVPFVEGPIIIGYSVLGQPLDVYRFGTGPIKRMIVAGIHGGNEWNTIVLADQLISYLYTHPYLIPTDKTLYILRNLNPDGEIRVHGVEGRVNENGVDLNRNWPAFWKKDWDRTNCWRYRPVSGGPYPASEPETQSLITFIEENNINALISYHSAALGIFPGGQPSHPLSLSLAEAVSKVSNYPYPPIDIGCDYTGNLTDWASSVKGIAAIDIELTNHRDSDFDVNLEILQVFLNWKP